MESIIAAMESLPLETRKEVFRAIVQAQDQEKTVEQSRTKVAIKYDLSIEREGSLSKRMESSFIDDKQRFRNGSVEFDCALLMRNVQHEWHGRPSLCADLHTESKPHLVTRDD